MNLQKIVFLVSMTTVLIIFGVNSRCLNLNEIEICNSASICFCRKCLTCPKGYGLNVECWGRLPKGTVMKCIPCLDGKTYSADNSTSKCQQCPHCDGKKVLQKCNATTPTKCSPNECQVGYEYNGIVDSCEPVASPSPTPTSLPPTTVASTTRRSLTTAKSTQGSTVPQVPRTNATGIVPSMDNQEPSIAANQGDDAHDDTKPHLHWYTITLPIIVVVLLAVMVAILFWARDKIKTCLRNKCGSTKDATNGVELQPLQDGQESPSSKWQQVCPCPWPEELLLANVPYELLWQIHNNICKENPPSNYGWRSIGSASAIGITKEVLDPIENCKEEERGKMFIKVLNTRLPKLTLMTFVEVLENLQRKDLVLIIHNHFQNCTNAVCTQ